MGVSFANGAITAAYTFLLNDKLHRAAQGGGGKRKSIRGEQRERDLEERKLAPKTKVVYELGADASAALGAAGISIEAGITWDDQGKYDGYLRVEHAIGLDASVGFQASRYNSFEETFNINDVTGLGHGVEVGLGPLDFGLGSSPLIQSYSGPAFSVHSFGISAGLPLAATVNSGKTW